MMKLMLHGVRGSRPTHKPHLSLFGGHSTSVQFLLPEDFYLFLDGGSGLANIGRIMGSKPEFNRFHFLITHTHWDHILGFPMFEPFYESRNKFNFYASNTSQNTFKKLFFVQSQSKLLPIPTSQIKAQFDFIEIGNSHDFFIENKVKVSTYQLNHQGITLGYRVEYDNCSCCIITDTAPIQNGNYLGENMAQRAKPNPKKFEKEFDEGLINFIKDAHTVVYDTHFTNATIKEDWGHSTPEIAVEACIKANNKRLILFHHAPEDSDDKVKEKYKSIAAIGQKNNLEIVAATEEVEWNLESA